MHELSVVLNHEPSQVILSMAGEMAMRNYDGKQEDEANWLGWMLLLPRPALAHCVRMKLTVSQIAEEYEVSEQLVRRERWELIEPEAGVNGKNGYVVLTEKGAESDAQVDFENLRQRRLLVPEMLHSKLRGDVYADFLAGKFGKAVFGAFKIVEMEVRKAAGLTERDHCAQLMQIAFNERNGPLTDPAEDPTQQKAPAPPF
jgi:Protein of unknown function (Hypoth_ymh)/IrrE N-terminal-like domain